MTNKQHYLLKSSFAFLIFVMIGYTVQFYPNTLHGFDSYVQNAVRGQLPSHLTSMFKAITVMGNVLTQFILVFLFAAIFYIKKWKIEALLVLINGAIAGILIVAFKQVYQRIRPDLEHLVHAGGFSFPSGHSLGSFLILGSLIIIIHDRVKHGFLKYSLQLILGFLILLIGLSRIYVGVHYPSDVFAGFVLGYGILNLIYPYYLKKRFEWRFHSKQQ